MVFYLIKFGNWNFHNAIMRQFFIVINACQGLPYIAIHKFGKCNYDLIFKGNADGACIHL